MILRSRTLWLIVGLAATTLAALGPLITSETQTRSKSKRGDYRIKVKFPVLHTKSADAKAMVAKANIAIQAEMGNQQSTFVREFGGGPPADSNGAEYELSIDFENGVLRPRVMSTMFTVYEYTGGAHGNTGYVHLNFGTVGAKPIRLKLAHLFRTRINPVPVVSKLVMAKLAKREGADWVRSGEVSSLSAKQAEQFRIVSNGLEFVFEPYSMGPYSSGTFRVLLSWSELSPHLDRFGPLKGLF